MSGIGPEVLLNTFGVVFRAENGTFGSFWVFSPLRNAYFPLSAMRISPLCNAYFPSEQCTTTVVLGAPPPLTYLWPLPSPWMAVQFVCVVSGGGAPLTVTPSA